MDLQSVLLWILLILIFLTAFWYLTVPRNLPPGSAGVPLLGYLPFINPFMHYTFTKLGQKYGNFYYLYIGSNLTLVLNDFAAIKEALIKPGDIFTGRFRDADLKKVSSTFEDEISHFVKKIREENGGAIEFVEYLGPSIANNIQLLVTGQRFAHEHPTMKALMTSMKLIETATGMWPLTSFFPWAKHIIHIIYPNRLEIMRRSLDMIVNVNSNILCDVRASYVDGQNDNYLYAYLTERNKRLKINKYDNIFTETGLIVNTRNLLLAGIETTTTTLAWAALYMALHPDVQKRVQREIDDVIGRHREPSYADRINTPYTEATINELHRVVSVFPLGIPIRTTNDTTLFGYRIPKDTGVFANLWAVHHDVSLWGDPENFRPERFIGPKGECMKPEYLIPFGIGKRTCAGEPLARMEIYLYFVSLLQHFDFVTPEGVKLTAKGKPGFISKAKSRLLCVKPRSM